MLPRDRLVVVAAGAEALGDDLGADDVCVSTPAAQPDTSKPRSATAVVAVSVNFNVFRDCVIAAKLAAGTGCGCALGSATAPIGFKEV